MGEAPPKSRPSWLWLAILIVSLFLNVVLLAILTGKNKLGERYSPRMEEEVLADGVGDRSTKIAVVDLRGLISTEVPGVFGDSMVEDIALELKQAVSDPKVRGIVLRVDSPGGEVGASDTLYHEIAKTRNRKPVVVYMESIAASGGYYASLGASYIMAGDLSITGSIGVIIQTFNFHHLLDKIGVKLLTFKSGKLKDLLNPGRDVTPEEEAYVQGLVNESYQRFVELVARERKLKVDELKDRLADGRIFSGKQALEAKLVDGLGYFEDAVRKCRELAGAPAARLIRYVPGFSVGRLLRLFSSQSPKVEITVGPKALPLESGRLYYLTPLAVWQ
ncbi:signal peptide peptidase SppA [Candidatus Methylacidithermus pantelleriae]|uniref:Periplasmic serine protease, ClpP class n=1 Tax=Candidatus Methylacidithermus pantelleriae TaxID=2744239 RepID=A0A8J2FW97_9BACT|nr:signal peptide peptidase SppA [Candidatus Methylacidithermus pantelleriae]CAF0698035.1 Periplasmic serine protease, ClpP class [Candidatus Methylacidithermus pantelleriae]